MTKDINKKRKQDLGIFYTPPEVVGFIFDILNIWKSSQGQRWQQKFPSVIDPACGEGIFLKKAVDSEFTSPRYIWGVDLDEKVKEEWEKITLLKSFGSKAKLDFHFYHQDGLLPIPEKKVRHKKGGMNQYDAVVGNPPYGGIGINEITPELEKALFNFQIWKQKFQKEQKQSVENLGLFETTVPKVFQQKIVNFPIEILFIDRFIQLAKPGGWIAIIIPDGILTNSNSHYVREFISQRTKVEAIVSLPRDTFKDVGTNAKTSILFLRKLKKDEKSENSYPVFLASINKVGKDQLNLIVKSYKKIYTSRSNDMNNSNKIQITSDQNKNETVMVRVDKTLKQLMEEKPASRWNADYWHPKYDDLLAKISNNSLKMISDYKEVLTSGYRGTLVFTETGIPALKVRNVLDTGIDLVNIDYLPDNSPANTPSKKVKHGDLIINRSGTGSIGRMSIFLSSETNTIITGDVYLLRLKNINPFYVNIYLKTYFGKTQIHRFESGVSGQTKIDLEEILYIFIPVLSDKVQSSIEQLHRDLSADHETAMKAKKNGDEKTYKENIKLAEHKLKDLIKNVEEVIEGKREDVN